MSAAAPLRILRVIARLNIGGPARHVAILDAGLRELGHETLLVYGAVGEGEGSFENLVTESGLPARHVAALGRSVSLVGDLKAFVTLVQQVFRFRPDVVHTHTAKAGTLGRLAAAVYNGTRRARRRCLVVHTFHGNVFSGYFSPHVSGAVRVVERLMAQVTDRIVVIADQQRREIVDRFQIAPSRKVVVVPLGLDLQPFARLGAPAAAAKALFGFDESHVVFGFVGRFVPVKDLDTLLRATARAASQTPALRLLMVGDGELKAKLESLARSLGIAEVVHMTGWRQDLVTVYEALDVGVLSSLNEGTPVALIEAMAAGRPVVSTQVGGVEDVVRGGRTGLLVSPGDAEELAGAMVRLTLDAGLRRELGAAARADVVRRYGRERLVKDMAELYDTGVAAKRRGGAPAGPDAGGVSRI